MLVFGVLFIGEACHCFAAEAPAVPGDVCGEDDCNCWVDPRGFPALFVGPPDEYECEDRAEAGDGIGHHVFAVGFEGDGAGASAELFEPEAHAAIDEDGEANEQESDVDVGNWLWSEDELVHRFAKDDRGGDADHATFERGGDEFKLAVAVGVVFVSGRVGGADGVVRNA